MYPRLLYAVPGAEPGQNQTDRWYDGLRHSFQALQLTRLVGVAACVIYAAAAAPSSHAAADPNKVLRIALEAADDGMDAMRTNSLYTTWLVQNVFENLLRYDHMARPAKTDSEFGRGHARDFRRWQNLYRAHQKKACISRPTRCSRASAVK